MSASRDTRRPSLASPPRALDALPPAAWVVLAWAALFLPNLGFWNMHWEEARNAMIARSFLADGDWLLPKIYGAPWPEKPQLLGWINAALGWLTGGIDERLVRTPNAVAALAGALMVQRLVGRHAGPAASLFAAGCWLVAPITLAHMVGEPDILLSALSFAAFLVWWEGRAAGRVAWWRWLVCGVLLIAVAAAKGPQPVGFFALGIASYTLLRRAWRDIPGLALCLAMPAAAVAVWGWAVYQPTQSVDWLTYMRMRGQWTSLTGYLHNSGRFFVQVVAQSFPANLLALPCWWQALRHGARGGENLGLALLLYAGIVTLALVFWPGASARYALPALPATAAAAGLAMHALLQRRGGIGLALRRVGVGALAAFALYRLALMLVVMPLRPDLFTQNRATGQELAALMAADPAPFLALAQEKHNVVWYMAGEPRMTSMAELAALPDGAWLLLWRPQLDAVASLQPRFAPTVVADLGDEVVLARLH